MTSIRLVVTGAKARAEVDGILTSGAAGIPVAIEYDDVWDGLTKNLVCSSGRWGAGERTGAIMDVQNSAAVAREVMIAGYHLYLGIEGYNAEGDLVIPTSWADCGYICSGADVNASQAAQTTLPVWAQLQQQMKALKNGATFFPAVGADGVLSWTNDKGLDNPDPVSLKGPPGENYVLSDADKDNIAEAAARKVPSVTTPAVPAFVSSEAEMVDISKVYVNTETGTFWRYQEATVTREVSIDCDTGYSYPENTRLGSGAPVTSGSYAGYTVTPFIDLLAYPAPFTLHLDGAAFLVPALDSYTRVALYTADQTLIVEEKHPYTTYDMLFNVTDADVSVDSDGNGSITFSSTPAAVSGAALRYIRISGKVSGTPHVYVTYDETVSGTLWVDTGVVYAPNITEAEKQQIADDIIARIDTALLSVVGSGEVV